MQQQGDMIHKFFSLTGKTALVTGGARGIGYHYAQVLAGAGANVVLADIVEDAARVSAKKLTEEFGVRAMAVAADVTDPASCASMVAATVNALGSLDIAVANAGISIGGINVMDFTAEQWDRLMAVNLKGVFLTDQAAARAMITQGKGGRIVNLCSMTATCISVHPHGSGAAYSASKAGVKQLTRAFAYDLAQYKITVNSLSPGWFRTEMTADYWDDPEKGGEKVARTPLRRPGEVEDLSGMMLYLASDASAFMTGTDVIIDGGFSIP